MNRKQLTVFFILLAVYALCAFVSYAFLLDQMTSALPVQVPAPTMSPLVLGLANAGVVLVAYGLLGLAGLWLARRLGLPGVFREDGTWVSWFLVPMALGMACGILLIVGDLVFAGVNGFGRFVHPPFPSSILASLTAGIGEEILFRGFVFGVWAFLLNWLFKRFQGRTAALWTANVIAALAFGAGHFASVMLLTGAKSLAEVNPLLIVEVLLLNGFVGVIAGQRYMRDGLIAASGVHFWTDVVFHVFWGLV